MAMIKCPECGNEISNRVPNCIFCGYPISEITTATPTLNEPSAKKYDGNHDKKKGNPKKNKAPRKKFIWLLIPLILLLSITLIVTNSSCNHEWTNATCTSPQKCIHCNITNGEPISHSFSVATCESPKTCTVCGVTEGDVLPHSWGIATCQSPKTCTVCGTTEGSLLSHTWTEATCSHPKTCTVCGVTEGDKLPHTSTEEWVTQKTDYVYAETVKVKTCSVCGEVVKREIIDLETLHDGTFFLISAEDFITRLGNKLASYTGNNYKTKGASTDDSYACGVVENGVAVSVLIFTKNDNMLTKDKRADSCAFNKLFGKCEADAVTRVSCALMQTADPMLSLDDAKEYAQTMISNNSVSVNGVKYIFMEAAGQYILGFTIE